MDKALCALDYVIGNMRRDGGFFHFMEDGPRRFGLLTDQVAMLRALLSAYQLTSDKGRLAQALETLEFMDRTMWDGGNGGYFDLPNDPDALGALAYRSKPFMDNAEAAIALKTLEFITGDAAYGEKAVACLRTHLYDYQEYGYMAAGYALAAQMAAGAATEIVLVGGDERADALRKAALSCYVPRRVVRLLKPGEHDAEIKARGYAGDGSAAYVCRGTSCSARIIEPAELVRQLENP